MERHIEIACFEAAAADPYAQFESQDILVLLRIIAELEENATAQALALKAANERADANERDAGRYRWLSDRYHGIISIDQDNYGARSSSSYAICFYVNGQMSREGSFDDVVDRMKSFVPSRAPTNGVRWEKSDDGTWKKVT